MRIYATDFAPASSPMIKQTCFPKDANPPAPFLLTSSLENQGDEMGSRTQAHCTTLCPVQRQVDTGGRGEAMVKGTEAGVMHGNRLTK